MTETRALQPVQSTVEVALCRSVLHEAAAVALRPSGAAIVARLASPAGREVLVSAARILDSAQWGEEEGGELGSELLAHPTLALVDEAATAAAAELEIARQRLFGHTARGAVPPYETEYGPQAMFRQTQELADLSGFYQAFGLEVSAGQHERQDHFAVEFEFMAFLTRKEALALEEPDAGEAGRVAGAQRLFLRDHLGGVGRAFATKLIEESGGGFFTQLGRFCRTWLAWECQHFSLPVGLEYIELRSTEEAEVPMACGSCEFAGDEGRGAAACE